MTPLTFRTQPPAETTTVFVGRLGEAAPDGAPAPSGVLVVESAAWDRFEGKLRGVASRFVEEPRDPIVLEGGEKLKDARALVDLWAALKERELERASFVMAAGGGALLDLAGFAAATWLRGVALASVPTTLVGQVDAALGGKSGVNVLGAKNQAGAIRQPRYVLADPSLLEGLPEGAFRSGLGEIAKTALLSGGELHERVLAGSARLKEREVGTIEGVAAACLAFKAGIVAEDPHDLGRRAILNLGHTAGHVYEAAALERGVPITHGDAVAAGLVAEAHLAGGAALGAVRDLLRALGLEESPPFRPAAGEARALLGADKKRGRGTIRMPLLRAPGDVLIEDVPLERMLAVLAGD